MKVVSPLASKWSGSIAGLTGSHNRGGMYLRQRSTPSNPNTVYQQAVRSYTAQLANLWTTALTAVQRDAWTTYADNVGVVDRNGQTIYLTGLNHYIRSNNPRLQVGLDRVDTAPTVYNVGDYTPPTITFSAGTPDVVVAYEETDDWVAEDGAAMLVASSRPQNPGINYFKGPYRSIPSILGDSGSPPTSPQLLAPAFAFATGQKVFAFVRVTRADGRLSNPFRGGDVAGA